MTERDLNPDERQHELDEAIERDWLRIHRLEQTADEAVRTPMTIADADAWRAYIDGLAGKPTKAEEADLDAFGAGIDAIHDAVRK